jgi:hypothetical protein
MRRNARSTRSDAGGRATAGTHPGAAHEERLREVIKLWQPRSKEPLTLADAAVIMHNVRRFRDVLLEIDARQRSADSNKAQPPPR